MKLIEDLLCQCTVKLIIPGRSGWGTGFFVAPGLIMTCAHVVEKAQTTVQVCWQGQRFLEATVHDRQSNVDLALLQFTPPADSYLPSVLLDADLKAGDDLYLFGYPDGEYTAGCPVTASCEGIAGNRLVKFKLGQIQPGMSGSALLNRRTGKVCGVVKSTRNRSSDLGGGAIATETIWQQFPELVELQRQVHEQSPEWNQLLPHKRCNTSLDNFCGFLNWIDRKSNSLGLRHLEIYHQNKLRQAIEKAEHEQLDFQGAEIEVLNLVLHHAFYCVENLYSPKFGRMKQKDYFAQMRKIVHSNQKIRLGDVCLSSLVEGEMSKLVRRVER